MCSAVRPMKKRRADGLRGDEALDIGDSKVECRVKYRARLLASQPVLGDRFNGYGTQSLRPWRLPTGKELLREVAPAITWLFSLVQFGFRFLECVSQAR